MVRSEVALEFSFDSEELKSAVVDEAMALRHLGEVTTRSLIGLVADMREAMFRKRRLSPTYRAAA